MITVYSAFTKTQAKSHASQKQHPKAPRSFQKALVLLEHICARGKIHLTLFSPHQLCAGSADDLVVFATWQNGERLHTCVTEREREREEWAFRPAEASSFQCSKSGAFYCTSPQIWQKNSSSDTGLVPVSR